MRKFFSFLEAAKLYRSRLSNKFSTKRMNTNQALRKAEKGTRMTVVTSLMEIARLQEGRVGSILCSPWDVT